MYSFVPIDRVQRMKLFESEGWKSFRLNSLAVILGVVITFGGGRLYYELPETAGCPGDCRAVQVRCAAPPRYVGRGDRRFYDRDGCHAAMCRRIRPRGVGQGARRYAPLRPELVFLRARENQECCFRCQMDDTLGSGVITRGLVPACGLNEAIRAELEDIRTVGY